MSVPIRPCISLVIPTRERAATLGATIGTALDQASERLEVLVSDNASRDGTKDVVHGFEDPRLRYVNTGRRLSMSDNYEFALGHVRGEYVIFIGDDDAVMPGGLDRLSERIRAAGEPTVFLWPLHCYDWPEGGQPARVAHLAPSTPPTVLDLRKKARFVVSMGGWKYYELPCPYHAAVPVAILDAIRERTGRVFHSVSPDVFTAMAIPAFADRAVNLGFPITLNGRSAVSNARGFTARSGLPNIQRFLDEYGDYQFHRSLYSAASGAAKMIPDAVLVAKDLFPEVYGETAFNYDAMWAFACRLGFASFGDVLKRWRGINRSHPFHPTRFLLHSLVQRIAVARRRLLDRRASTSDLSGPVPDNIAGFVKMLAVRDGGGART